MHVPFRVIFAENVFDAIKQLAVDAQTRWKDIIDCTPELNRHRDFVGRQWLKERVQVFTLAGLEDSQRDAYIRAFPAEHPKRFDNEALI